MGKAKRILTWHGNHRRPGGRWRKYVDGKVQYFGHGKSPTDLRSYRNAERKYFEFLQQREVTKPVEIQLQNATVSAVCEKYLQQLEDRCNRNDASPSYLEKTRCCLQDFTDFVGAGERFNSVRELCLDGYRSHTLNLPVSPHTERPILPSTAKGRLNTVKTLYRWAYKMYLLDLLPRNLDDLAKMPQHAARPVVKTFSMDELKTLFGAATEEVCCFMLLALNTGMGQKDISDLRMKEVDWSQGYVERERSKTQVKAKHKLWPDTLRLMMRHCQGGAGPGDRVFLNGNDLPLVRRWIEDGRARNSDAIKNKFDRLLKKVGIDAGRGFYCLRKTGATLIESIDPLATEMYLAHAEGGMKRAYAQRDWQRLEKALSQMAEMLGFLKTGFLRSQI